MLTRTVSVFITAGLILFTAATPALAAPPSNDTFGNAIAVTSIPFSTSLDTREATTDAIDQEARVGCGAPAIDATVWYDYTATADAALLLDSAGSNYSVGFLVVSGEPGGFVLENCGPRAATLLAKAGVTYHIMVLDYADPQNGGDLTFTTSEIPPPPDVTLTVDPIGFVDKQTGTVDVGGTFSCTGQVEFSFIIAELHQRVGRGEVAGGVGMEVACDGLTRPWSATISPSIGTKFTPSKAASFTLAVACGPAFCTEGFVAQEIKLKSR